MQNTGGVANTQEHSALANWNGTEMPLQDVQVSVLDRSFLFGDGVYEVVRVYQGRPFLLGEHLSRLQSSLDELRIAFDLAPFQQRTQSLLRASGVSDGTLYFHVSRGVAPRTHHFPENPTNPNALIYVKKMSGDPYGALRATGVKTILFPDWRWKRCDIKSVNLLANCLAAQAAREAGCFEALLVDDQNFVSEGSHSSVFGVRDGTLLTSALGQHLLPGITRKLVMYLAGQLAIPVQEESICVDDIRRVDELFITGTTSEVMPVIQAGETMVGQGTPGPVTRRLQAEYQRLASLSPDFVPS